MNLTVLIQMNFGILGNLFSILPLKSTHQPDYEKLEVNTDLRLQKVYVPS